jgi:hypothetical protein
MKKLIILILFPLFSYGQILELYTGGVEARNKELKFSALAGGNLYLDLFQSERQGNSLRVYANRALVGFEHSVMTSGSGTIEDVCGCYGDPGDIHDYKHRVRAVSLNAGIEIYKGWYLLTGVSSYQHIIKIDNELVKDYRTMYIDAGLQKVIPYNRWYFIPKIKFNRETTSFAIGVSYK